MPIICFKNKIKIDDYEENISIAFDCEYDEKNRLKLKNHELNYFDSGDFRLKLDNLIKKLDRKILNEYDKKNNGVRYLGLLNYFTDEIPSIHSIKFESEEGDSIYYSNEVK